jgi:GTP cyclohydrolase FolE2
MTTTITLPTYNRRASRFDDVFGAPAAAVLRSMDAAGDDLVQREPLWPIALSEVGCRRDRLIVHVQDPFESGQMVPAICSVSIGTAVPATRRGVHMSRIGDALADAVQRSYPDVASFAEALASLVEGRQYGGPTAVRVEATIPYLEELPDEGRPAAKTSVEHLTLLAAAATGPDAATDLGLRLTHIVACPCVQRTGWHARPAAARADRIDEAPRFTHAQRCETTVTVRGATRRFAVPAMLEELDGALVRTVNTMPRGSELLLVFRAHRSPQFVEDAVREALWAAYRGVPRGGAFSRIEVTARSLESIHDFDLSATAQVSREDAERLWGREPSGTGCASDPMTTLTEGRRAR